MVLPGADPSSFRDEGNWSGFYYELAIELGERGDQALDRAFRALWLAARVEGCFASRSVEPHEQPALDLQRASIAEAGWLYGRVRLPSGERVVCTAMTVREDDGPDWLDFCLPEGALALVDPRVHALVDGNPGSFQLLACRRPLDDWLAEIARQVYRTVPFRLALVGCEVSGATEFAAETTERPVGYLRPRDGELVYFPATR